MPQRGDYLKTLYLDCFCGISGDKMLGLLVDLGVNLDVIIEGINKMGVSGFLIKAERKKSGFIEGTNVWVNVYEEQPYRNLKDIIQMIESSTLAENIKGMSKQMFYNLARGEAKAHGQDEMELLFHEKGAVDTIVDIVGTAIGIHKLGFDRVYSSPLHLGSGFLKMGEKRIPIPSPAAIEILKGVPVYSNGIPAELVTPTGAAIVVTLAEEFRALPPMAIVKVGYGCGKRELEIPDMLRGVVMKA